MRGLDLEEQSLHGSQWDVREQAQRDAESDSAEVFHRLFDRQAHWLGELNCILSGNLAAAVHFFRHAATTSLNEAERLVELV